MKITTLVILFAYSNLLVAQHKIQIKDPKTGEAIEGVMAQISFESGENEVLISNKKGQLAIIPNPPYTISLSHLNYHNLNLQITDTTTQLVELSPKSIILDDIVVTGQYQPQSASNSVYSVKTIDASTIKSQGAIQLSDVLSRQLNIRISPDVAIGSSEMSLQGIPGKNVKILIDGVPMVNRNGNGNGADLSQIIMANVERIEIVEGPMAVNYGANALAGVVNIITKKPEQNTFRLGVELQGESIDNAYNVDDGSSNFNITSGFSLPKSFLLSVNGGATRFGGYKGIYTGREYEWNPKDQLFYDASLSYKKEGLLATYKFEGLNEVIFDLDSTQFDYGESRFFGVDRSYTSNRFAHQVQVDMNFSEASRLNVLASYSNFNRQKRTYKNYLNSSEEIDFTTPGSSDTTNYKATVGRLTYNNSLKNRKINYQAGIETNLESTSGGRIKNNEIQRMSDVAAFASVELLATNKLKFRPGLRFAYNSSFDNSVVPSINVKYKFSENVSIGAAYGKGYRTPSLRELFFEFIDANHTVIGNENLTPEYSDHVDLNLTHKWNKTKIGLKSELSLFYNNITDLIGFGYDPVNLTFAQYFNLNNLQTVGGTLNETFIWGHLTLGTGFGITGKKEEDEQINAPSEFFFSPEISLDFSYIERISKISFAAFYKFNGETSSYFINENDELSIGNTAGYHLLDVTANRRIIKNTDLTLGIKNLLDVRSVTNSATTTSGVHSGSQTDVNIGYGRSFFFKIAYNLIKN